MKTHAVEIVESATGNVIKTLEYASDRIAERAERGVERNLNHEEFYLRVVKIKPTKATKKKAARNRVVHV